MKITAVRTVIVWARRMQPYGRVARSALGGRDISEHGIVFVDTDEGITGIGEVATVFARRGSLLCHEIDRVLGPAMVGEDPFRIAHLVTKMEAVLDYSEQAKAGIEVALWDIVGKALNTPLYNLLGGKTRDRIPLSYSLPFGSPEEMAAFAKDRVQRGHKTVKVKVGNSPDSDLKAVARVREAIGPSVRLRVDANMGWRTAKEAISLIRRMEAHDLELAEQPLDPKNLQAMAEVRRAISIPLMADESIRTPRDAMDVIRAQAADIANVYVSEAGGLLNATRIFSLCEAAGIPCMIGSMPELGIGTAAQIHLGISMANLGPASDTCGVLYHIDDVLQSPLRIEDGWAYPPEGPGLGITLNMDEVERLSRH